MTPRPTVAVAEAVGAVIAAQLQRDLVQLLGQPLPDSVASLLGRNAVMALRQDGWHIGHTPPPPAPTDTAGSHE
ncbi:hypothetical protein ACFWCB_26235 [Streptomyces sp. NPDC060048]|uniref:hypothetical protein n=1 Tax=unclassified Streptomyces TaxID=2593676 RepID=UPI0036C4E346